MTTLKEKIKKIDDELLENKQVLYNFIEVISNPKVINKIDNLFEFLKNEIVKNSNLSNDAKEKIKIDLIKSFCKSYIINSDLIKDFEMEEKIKFINDN